MRQRNVFAAIMLAFFAGGCASTSPGEQRSADETRCRTYGFRKGTDAFAKCLLDVDLDRAAERRARLAAPPVYGGPGWHGGRLWRYW